jgi:hypothetical protein
MRPYGHIDFGVVSIGRALDLGLRDFEHAYTIVKDVLSEQDLMTIWKEETLRPLGGRQEAVFFFNTMEMFRYVGAEDRRLIELIDRMAKRKAAMTPTLHIFASRFGLTWFDAGSSGVFDDTSAYTTELLSRGKEGYSILASYVKRMFDAGIRLHVGTDCGDPGKAVLSEILLLEDCGIPMSEVLRIASWNGAVALGSQDSIGSIEVGKRANLVLFEENPLEAPGNVLSTKTVIKEGVLAGTAAGRETVAGSEGG